MGRKLKQNVRLLERCFSRQEWEYLKRNKTFQEQLAKNNENVADAERLSKLGDQLLGKYERGHPHHRKFRRVGAKKPRNETRD